MALTSNNPKKLCPLDLNKNYCDLNPFRNGFNEFYHRRVKNWFITRIEEGIAIGYGGGNRSFDGRIGHIKTVPSACEFIRRYLQNI